jgi:hypothetical protein
MAGKPPPVPAGDHGAERGRIDQEDQHDVQQGEGDEDPDGPEVPVAGQLVPPEQGREPAQLDRFVDGEAGQDRQGAEDDDEGIGTLLQRVVLALGRVALPQPQVVELHLNGRPDIAGAEQQRPPLSRAGQEAEIHQPGDDEGPGQGEVPVEPAGEPAPEPGPAGDTATVERIGVVGRAPRTEVGEGEIDLEPAGDHA